MVYQTNLLPYKWYTVHVYVYHGIEYHRYQLVPYRYTYHGSGTQAVRTELIKQ